MANKKNVLEEGTIRRWMTLVGNPALADGVIKRINEDMGAPEEEEKDEEALPPAPADESAPEAAPVDDVPPAEGEGGPSIQMPEEQVAELTQALADAIAEKTGVAVSVETGAEEAAEGEMPPPEMEEAPAEEEKLEAPAALQESPYPAPTPYPPPAGEDKITEGKGKGCKAAGKGKPFVKPLKEGEVPAAEKPVKENAKPESVVPPAPVKEEAKPVNEDEDKMIEEIARKVLSRLVQEIKKSNAPKAKGSAESAKTGMTAVKPSLKGKK